MTKPKPTHKSGVHPTEAVPATPLDGPVSAATGAQLLTQLAITEREAQTILAAKAPTPNEIALLAKVDLHSLALALDENTVHALVTDPKVELPAAGANLETTAADIRTAASAGDKLQGAIDALHGSCRADADTVQGVLNDIVPQLKGRARVNAAVKATYSSILAYQHARFPGRPSKHDDPPPAPPTPPAPPAS